ncbi:transcription initiation factor IIB [Candidatus Thorarchaeota archaeon]|nr:MAG: transcription initiation factor IIB [Candidatus Thorarchaeota archaeon]
MSIATQIDGYSFLKKVMSLENLVGTKDSHVRRKRMCMGCGQGLFTQDYTRGEYTCTTCGLVASERSTDTGPEWRAFTAEERNARDRTGAPMTLTIADKGISTVIDWRNKDAGGRALTSTTRAAMYRMRKWHIRSRLHSSEHRNLSIAMSEMQRLSSQLGIPYDVQETAALIYRKALMKRIVRGRSIESVVAASIYLACRIHRIPRSLDEIAKETDVGRKKIGHAVRLIVSKIEVNVPLPSAKDLIPRLSADLMLDGRTVKRATDIIQLAKERYVSIGKSPGGIAGAALYIAGILEEDRRTQREIARVSRVTEVTIRNRYKELVRSLGITFNMDS